MKNRKMSINGTSGRDEIPRVKKTHNNLMEAWEIHLSSNSQIETLQRIN